MNFTQLALFSQTKCTWLSFLFENECLVGSIKTVKKKKEKGNLRWAAEYK